MATEHVKDIELSSLQKAFVGAFVVFVTWMGVTVYNMSLNQAVMSSQVETLVANAGDRYTGNQAAADKAALVTRLEASERRIERLEAKHGI